MAPTRPNQSSDSTGSTQSGSVLTGSSANSFGGNLSQTTVKLEKENFLLWHNTILPAIRGHRLEGYLTGEKVCPPKFLVAQTGADGTVTGPQLNPAYDDWITTDQLLLGWLYSTITPPIAMKVMNSKTSKQLWDSVKQMFGAQNRARVLYLTSELQRARKGTQTIDQYLSHIKMIGDSLEVAGKEIEEPDLINHALNGLDGDYLAIVTVLGNQPNLTWEELQATLMTYESRLEHINSFQNEMSNLNLGQSTANYANKGQGSKGGYQQQYSNSGRSGGRGRSNRGRGRSGARGSKPTCQVCTKYGHSADVCYHRFDESYTSANPQNNQNKGKQYAYSAMTATPEAVADPAWLMDSGASHHVTAETGAAVSGARLGTNPNATKILSYNVWFREDLELHKRMKSLGDLIQLHSPDVICFQEVTPDIYKIFKQSGWWKGYRCSIASETEFPGGYFCMQLTNLRIKRYACKPFTNSIMGRELCIAEVESQTGPELVIATTHLESPCPGPPTWDQMFSKERVAQANEAIKFLEKNENAIFCGDMNWDDKLDGQFPLTNGWIDAWTELRPTEVGWTYDTKSNKMLSGNRTLQKRLDRFLCKLRDFKISGIEMIGKDEIPGLSYVKEKKVKSKVQKLVLPVLPSDHYGLLLTICPNETTSY